MSTTHRLITAAALTAAATAIWMLLSRLDRRLNRAAMPARIETWEGEGGALAPEQNATRPPQVPHAVG